MTSPRDAAYRRPFTHPAFHNTSEPSPAQRHVLCEQLSALRATERRAEALAVAEACSIVARKAGRADR